MTQTPPAPSIQLRDLDSDTRTRILDALVDASHLTRATLERCASETEEIALQHDLGPVVLQLLADPEEDPYFRSVHDLPARVLVRQGGDLRELVWCQHTRIHASMATLRFVLAGALLAGGAVPSGYAHPGARPLDAVTTDPFPLLSEPLGLETIDLPGAQTWTLRAVIPGEPDDLDTPALLLTDHGVLLRKNGWNDHDTITWMTAADARTLVSAIELRAAHDDARRDEGARHRQAMNALDVAYAQALTALRGDAAR